MFAITIQQKGAPASSVRYGFLPFIHQIVIYHSPASMMDWQFGPRCPLPFSPHFREHIAVEICGMPMRLKVLLLEFLAWRPGGLKRPRVQAVDALRVHIYQ